MSEEQRLEVASAGFVLFLTTTITLSTYVAGAELSVDGGFAQV
jgi:hypothetical protein